MKREIKFRAWDKVNKCFLQITPYEWINSKYTDNKPAKVFYNEFDLSETNCDRKTGKSVFLTLDGSVIGVKPIEKNITESIDYSDAYILMQFTGLQDKNGVEIYEGDILFMLKDSSTKPPYLHDRINKEVYFEDGMFKVYKRTVYQAKTLYNTSFEVIGNIHENPELI